MILDRLILKNFKRFRDEEIDFRDGITGILGNNGTGKSSLVTAIFFALYGVQGTGISPDYIVSSFAGPREKCEVRLDFRIGGEMYTVLRTFKKGKTVSHDATFHQNGKLMATGVSPVEEAVKRTLGMGPVDFRNTIYAAQKDLLTLLENTPGKRKEWFQKALGIDYLKNGSDDILRSLLSEKESDLQKMTGQIEALSGRLDAKELENLQESIRKFQASIAGHNEEKTKLAQQRTEADNVIRMLRERKAAHDLLAQQQSTITRELASDESLQKKIQVHLASLEKDEKEFQRLEKTAGAYAEIRARLDALVKKKAEHEQLTDQLSFGRKQIIDLEGRIRKEQAKLAELEKYEKELTRLAGIVRTGIGAGPDLAADRLDTAVSYRIAELDKKAGTLEEKQDRYEKEIARIRADQKTIAGAGPDGICPLCRQKLGAHFGDLEKEFAEKIQELEDKAVADLSRLENLSTQKGAIEALRPLCREIHSLALHVSRRREYEHNIGEIAIQLQAQRNEQDGCSCRIAEVGYDENAYTAAVHDEKEAQTVQARVTELGMKIGQAGNLKNQLATLTEKIAGRKTELARLEREILKVPCDPDETDAAEKHLKKIDQALHEADVAIMSAEKDTKHAEDKIREYREAEAEIRNLQKKSEELGEEVGLLKLTRSLISEYVIYLMQVVRSRIEGETSRILGEITGGRYEHLLLDGDFNILVRDVDDDYPVDRFSGGEQDDIAVALRIALSRYLAELHNVHESTVLIFDEIFGSQDEERRSNLLTALRTQESRFPQIFLISHIAEMQGEFATTLVVETGSDNVSRVREMV